MPEPFVPKRGLGAEARTRHLEEWLAQERAEEGVDQYGLPVPAAVFRERVSDQYPVINETSGAAEDTEGTAVAASVAVEEANVAVGTVATLDFQAGFDVALDGTSEVNISLDLTEVAHVFGVDSPAQITANQNDYALHATALYIRLSTDASRTITGFAAPATARQVVIVNVGVQDLVITNLDALSAAPNRVITGTGASVTIGPDESAVLFYDLTTARWRLGWRSP
jgi:hypothetical protein